MDAVSALPAVLVLMVQCLTNPLLVLLLAVWAVPGLIAGAIASGKGHGWGHGLAWGLCLGWIGVIIVTCEPYHPAWQAPAPRQMGS